MPDSRFYNWMKEKFAGKSVSFSAPGGGLYRGGSVLEVYRDDPNILIILDEDGAEIEVNFRHCDVIVQGE